MIEQLLAAGVLFLVVIDPIGMGPVFVGLTAGTDPARRRHLAVKGVALAAAVLLLFAVLGDPLLKALGIGFAAFRIAGGLLLFLLAVDMVLARPSGLRTTTASEAAEADARADISVFPLAVPLIAGPGAMTSVLLVMGRAGGDWAFKAAALGLLVAVLGLTLLSLLVAARMTRFLGVTGTNVAGRVMGIVLAALACQFVLDGLAEAGIGG
jgi:multiple antibiotic resistance protein